MSSTIADNAGALTWEQSIDLGHGLVTPGTEKTTGAELAARYALPLDLRGQSVVDLRARDGQLAAACLQRGAVAVVAIDNEHRRTIHFVRESLGYDNGNFRIKPHDVEEPLKFQADLMLCLDVINRVERPMEVIRNAVKTARRQVVIECALTQISEDVGNVRWDLERDKKTGPRWLPTEDAVLDAMIAFGCTIAKRINLTSANHVDGRASFVGTK